MPRWWRHTAKVTKMAGGFLNFHIRKCEAPGVSFWETHNWTLHFFDAVAWRTLFFPATKKEQGRTYIPRCGMCFFPKGALRSFSKSTSWISRNSAPCGAFFAAQNCRSRSLSEPSVLKTLVVYAECRAATGFAVFVKQSGLQIGLRSKPRRYRRERQSTGCSGV